jgi:hypothetical protein
MSLRQKYTLVKWTEWNKTISRSMDAFFAQYLFYPNVLLANSHTFSQIDFLINEIPNEKENICRKDELSGVEEPPKPTEFVKLSFFSNERAEVRFAVEEKLKDKEFILVYDPDPDFGDDDSFYILDIDEVKESKSLAF